jgi:DNA end-binding protein Ku
MRSIWKGSINFGLVNIPVKLYSATEKSTLDFDMVDRRDLARVRYKRVNESTGDEIDWEDIGKAYMYKGEYVVLENEDFEQAAPDKSKIIEINHFINENEIDTIYFENSYYVEPEKQGEKAYALLREALKKTGKIGVAQFVLRTAETLAVIKPMDNVLVLSKIRFAQEIRSTEEFNLPPKSLVKPEEQKMAVALIDQYTKPFTIEKFKNEYARALLQVIKARASGKKAKVSRPREAPRQAQSLMDQLKASLTKT